MSKQLFSKEAITKVQAAILAIIIIVAIVCFTYYASLPPPSPTLPPERKIRKIIIYCMPEGESREEYQSTELFVDEIRKLGLDVEIKPLPWAQLDEIIWYERDKWDATAWYFTSRPERSDPDELLYNCFHSSTAESGYNFFGYKNTELDKLLEAQRSETDIEKRRALVYEIQEKIAEDQPIVFMIAFQDIYVYNKEVWDPKTIVDQKGLGIRNFWTYINATPLTEQKDMILNYNEDVRAINPLYISGVADSWITELIWDRLMRVGPDGLPKPWAAKHVEWINDTTLEVTIREGMKWHDGQPVTVEDVKFSLEVPMGEESPMYKPFVKSIDHIEISSENKLTIYLKEPNAAFLTTCLAKINLIPKHIWEPIIKDLETKPENAEFYQEENPIGSGPFRFLRWKKGEEVVLEANLDHFSPPKMRRWIARLVTNPEVALRQLETKEINFLATYVGDYDVLVERVKQFNFLEPVATTTLAVRFLALNNRRPPFDDPVMRKAIAMVCPKQLLIEAVYKGFAVPADSIISPALEFWYNPNLPKYPYNVEQARALLKANGYEWDEEGRLYYPEGKTEQLG